jgi:hypothetical protein
LIGAAMKGEYIMAKTIKTSIKGPLTLSATDNPLLITIAGTITSTSGDGIYGDASAAKRVRACR